eukprot:CAMPEP_0194713386 /NCGR_PEP_ID=MMETSP0296-20130528/5269_1 /TAXON_ID=39354 /ORGANISM="Heterosigma akashiwo, Strain CCMP2393" /LENGTH=290 /DNA_ID=CAMNT_0039612131 /DNA_START=51 /DNA_END=926 /DNA_ORIENTATION=+
MAGLLSRRLITPLAISSGLLAFGLLTAEKNDSSCQSSDDDGKREAQSKKRLSELRDSLAIYRRTEQKMREVWEKDEIENFRKLPARAWPAYQPDSEEVPAISAALKSNGCVADDGEVMLCKKECSQKAFELATALVFNGLEPKKGANLFTQLGNAGHVDGMVAAGIVLVEGYGVPSNEEQGLQWLEKAALSGSTQGMFELGTAFYTGIDGVLDENESKAFQLFEMAAKNGHIGGMFMAADCMLEGIGTSENIQSAIPLLAEAAEQGHRYARQRMRELLDISSRGEEEMQQ